MVGFLIIASFLTVLWLLGMLVFDLIEFIFKKFI
jgi:hypothetical protein